MVGTVQVFLAVGCAHDTVCGTYSHERGAAGVFKLFSVVVEHRLHSKALYFIEVESDGHNCEEQDLVQRIHMYLRDTLTPG